MVELLTRHTHKLHKPHYPIRNGTGVVKRATYAGMKTLLLVSLSYFFGIKHSHTRPSYTLHHRSEMDYMCQSTAHVCLSGSKYSDPNFCIRGQSTEYSSDTNIAAGLIIGFLLFALSLQLRYDTALFRKLVRSGVMNGFLGNNQWKKSIYYFIP